MSAIYVIDACALIDAAHNYNMEKKAFSYIWHAFDTLVENGTLISSSEIMDELRDDDLKTWAKKHKSCFVPLSLEVQEKTREILQNYPNLIKIQSTANSNADPFLIATAVLNNGTVVTNERPGDIRNKDYRIPNVCQALNVPYMDLRSFLNIILE